MYSRWCNGARPIPIDILKTYEDEDEWDTMGDDFRDKIIPNLLNEAQARIQMEELITDSIKTIGHEMFYPQLGVKLCSMAGGGVQKSIWCFLENRPGGTGQAVTCSTSGMGLRLK